MQNVILNIRDESEENIGIEFMKDSTKYFELSIMMIELAITNREAKIISNLAKSIYSCKNILKRGKKRELLKRLLTKNSDAKVS